MVASLPTALEALASRSSLLAARGLGLWASPFATHRLGLRSPTRPEGAVALLVAGSSTNQRVVAETEREAAALALLAPVDPVVQQPREAAPLRQPRPLPGLASAVGSPAPLLLLPTGWRCAVATGSARARGVAASPQPACQPGAWPAVRAERQPWPAARLAAVATSSRAAVATSSRAAVATSSLAAVATSSPGLVATSSPGLVAASSPGLVATSSEPRRPSS
jgi:hypothetical protein